MHDEAHCRLYAVYAVYAPLRPAADHTDMRLAPITWRGHASARRQSAGIGADHADTGTQAQANSLLKSSGIAAPFRPPSSFTTAQARNSCPVATSRLPQFTV